MNKKFLSFDNLIWALFFFCIVFVFVRLIFHVYLEPKKVVSQNPNIIVSHNIHKTNVLQKRKKYTYILQDSKGNIVQKLGSNYIDELYKDRFVIRVDNNQVGVLNEFGKYIIPPSYGKIVSCGDSKFCAYRYTRRDKNGFKNQLVIESSYLFDFNGELLKKDVYIEPAIVDTKPRDNSKRKDYIFVSNKEIDEKVTKTVSIYDEKMNFVSSFQTDYKAKILDDNYIVVDKNGFQKLLDLKGREILPAQYENVFEHIKRNNKSYFVVSTISGSWKYIGLVDENNNNIIPMKYFKIAHNEKKSNLLWAKGRNSDFYTCYDYTGKIVENPDMAYAPEGAVTKLAGVDYTGVVPGTHFFKFDKNGVPKGINNYYKVERFEEHFYLVSHANLGVGIADKNGRKIVPLKSYTRAHYEPEGHFAMYYSSGFCHNIPGENPYCKLNKDVYNTKGIKIGTYYDVKDELNVFTYIAKGTAQKHFKNADINKEYFNVVLKEKYGVENSQNKVVIPYVYDEIKVLRDRKETLFFCKKAGKYAILNSKNEMITSFIFDKKPFRILENGLSIVRVEDVDG